MRAGDTFRATESEPGNDENRHLWVVLSDPDLYPDEVVVVFFSTLRAGFDQTCIIEAGDHPFITRRSVVAYTAADVRRHSKLLAALKRNKIELADPVGAELVSRIRMLLQHSPHISYRIAEIAKNQGFDQAL
jgi:hypothetical protein